MTTLSFAPPTGLTDTERELYQLNLAQLTEKYNRAVMRSNFYNTRKLLDEVGFSIPPNMRNIEAVLGWPAKAVDGLASRLKLIGFVEPGQAEPNEDLDYLFAQNRMAIEWPMTQISTLTHGCAFVAVTPGDVAGGEPEVLIQTMPATEATGIWDVRKRRLTSALWQPEMEAMQKTRAILFTEENTVEMSRDRTGPWTIKRTPNKLPRLPVTMVVHRPQLTRPYGASRINRSVQYLTQLAMRTLLRTEVSAEFYSSPQRYAMGADPEAFIGEDGEAITAWETVLGKVWLMGKDEDGDVPSVGQFAQATMQPHIEMMRMITTLFAGETSLPVSTLGIVHDNPASAAAIDAAWADMVQQAELSQVELGIPVLEIAQNALMVSENKRELTKPLVLMKPKWTDPSIPTRSAMADAVTKEIAAGVLLPHSRIALEKLGYAESEIVQIQAEHKAAKEEQAQLDAQVMNPVPGGPPSAPGNSGAPPAKPGASFPPGR
jgi:hypothetical protein